MPPFQHCESSNNDVGDGNGKLKFPADVHELVIAEAGKRATSPDVEKEEDENFCCEPENRLNEIVDPGEGDKSGADSRHGKAYCGENELAEDGFVFEAVVDDPEAEGNQRDTGNVFWKSPSFREKRMPASEKQD